MSRRAIAFLLLAATCLCVALAPWKVTSDRAIAAVARQMRSEYGLNLQTGGPVVLALLPVPRLRLHDVSFYDDAGMVLAEAAELKGELRLPSLLLGRVRMAELRVSKADIRIALGDRAEEAWPVGLDRLRQRLASDLVASSRIEKLVIVNSRLAISASRRPPLVVSRINAEGTWRELTGDVEVAGSAEVEGEKVSGTLGGLTPARLLAGLPDALTLTLTSPLGRLSALGELTWSESPQFQGPISWQTPSLAALARWSGVALDLREIDRPIAISGSCTVNQAGVQWPNAVLELGRDRLEGALAYGFGTPQPQLRATLAGGEVDFGWLLPIVDPRTAERPNADYDVRLSAQTVRLGAVRASDVATGILIGNGRAELSLARAMVAGGAVKGRISAGLDGEARDLKGQLLFDKLNLERLALETGWLKGVSGTVAGQAAFEAFGDGQLDIARRLKGRAAITARDGEIAGIALPDMQRRSETRSLAALNPEPRGRTRFDHASIAIEFGGGTAEITEGTLETTSSRTSFRGTVSLPDGAMALRATTRPATGPESRPAQAIDIRALLGGGSVLESSARDAEP